MCNVKPVVAIVGRQNVGKSTLFNKLAHRRIAIVEDLPGTTRDRLEVDVSWQGVEFTLVDTGGLQPKPESEMDRGVREQVERAIKEADAIVFMVDVRDGVMPFDLEIADMMRRAEKPLLLAANKADSEKHDAAVPEFFQLGLGEPMGISAYHGRGVAELLDRVVSLLPAKPPAKEQTGREMVKVAIIGRPNVGKSTLLNALLGEQRAIVSDVPGTTRDAIDTLIDFSGQSVLLIDTTGIRRRGRVEQGVERYSVMRAIEAVERADIVVLVLDATEMLTAQDLHIAGYIQQAAKGIVLVVNKCDMAEAKTATEYNKAIKSQLKFLPYGTTLYISAKLGQGVDKIMPQVFQVKRERAKRISTAAVNNVVQEAIASHSLPHKGGKYLKVLYATQAEINPPTFVFFVNDARLVHFSYQRHLENKLRQSFGFVGTPIRLVFKSRGES